MILHRNFSFKYEKLKKVYCLTNNAIPFNKSNPKNSYLSIPYDDTRYKRALVSFKKVETCMNILNEEQYDGLFEKPLSIIEIPLDDLKKISSIIKLPIIVILDRKMTNSDALIPINSFDPSLYHYDILYIRNETFDDSKRKFFIQSNNI